MSNQLTSTVAVISHAGYDPALLEARLERLLDGASGWDRLPSSVGRVLLIPDLTAGGVPLPKGCTHPEVTAALARTLRAKGWRVEIGATGPGGAEALENIWRLSGYRAVAERDGLELVDLFDHPPVTVALGRRSYPLSARTEATDLLIFLPKLKAHPIASLSGAVRCVTSAVPRSFLAELFSGVPSKRRTTSRLVDLLALLQPSLIVMDGIESVVERPGGRYDTSPLSYLIGSSDPVAVDVVASVVLGLRPEDALSTRLAGEAGLGIGWPEAIRSFPPGVLLRTGPPQYPPIKKLSDGRVLPLFDSVQCQACHDCVDCCPTGVLRTGSHGAFLSDPSRCNGCMRCFDFCPHGAIRPLSCFGGVENRTPRNNCAP